MRLEVLVGEYAAASQRPEALQKLTVILERVEVEADLIDPPAAAPAVVEGEHPIE